MAILVDLAHLIVHVVRGLIDDSKAEEKKKWEKDEIKVVNSMLGNIGDACSRRTSSRSNKLTAYVQDIIIRLCRERMLSLQKLANTYKGLEPNYPSKLLKLSQSYHSHISWFKASISHMEELNWHIGKTSHTNEWLVLRSNYRKLYWKLTKWTKTLRVITILMKKEMPDVCHQVISCMFNHLQLRASAEIDVDFLSPHSFCHLLKLEDQLADRYSQWDMMERANELVFGEEEDE
jgi:hypothetical protein